MAGDEKFVLGRSADILSPDSAKVLMDDRSKAIKLPWDEFVSEGAKRQMEELLEKGYNTLYEWYKRVMKEDEWAWISSLNGGKWVQVLEDVEKECNLA